MLLRLDYLTSKGEPKRLIYDASIYGIGRTHLEYLRKLQKREDRAAHKGNKDYTDAVLVSVLCSFIEAYLDNQEGKP